MHIDGTASNRSANSSENVLRDDLLVQQGQGIIGMLVQITSSQARLEQRVDGVSTAVADLKTTVANLSVDVKDLMQWKNRLWGMLILLGGIAAGSGGIWTLIDKHVSWTSAPSVENKSNTDVR